MKACKVVGLALLVSLLGTGAISAQEKKTEKDPQAIAAKRAERMKQTLNLTDDQATKVAQLEAATLQDRHQMMQAFNDARKNFREKVKARNEEMKKILTPEQYRKYAAKMRHMRDRMMFNMGKRAGMREGMQMKGHRMVQDSIHKQGPAHRMPMNGKHFQDKSKKAPADTQQPDTK
jgi:hypothetical protein